MAELASSTLHVKFHVRHTRNCSFFPFVVWRRQPSFFPFVVRGPQFYSIRGCRDPEEACTLTSAEENVSIRSGQTSGRDARAETGVCTRAMPLCSLGDRGTSTMFVDVPMLRRRVDVIKSWVRIGQPQERILLFLCAHACLHTSVSCIWCFEWLRDSSLDRCFTVFKVVMASKKYYDFLRNLSLKMILTYFNTF